MKTVRKALLLVLCAALLVGATAMGTYAYFTSTDSATNTFTVGKVAITLDEAKVDAAGKEITGDGAERVKENKYDNIKPGQTYDKDPTVTVKGGSEDSYVRILVTVTYKKEADEVLKQYNYDTKWFDFDSDWKVQPNVTTSKNDTHITRTYEFRHVGNDTKNPNNGIVVKATGDTKLDPLFTTITVPGEIINSELATLEGLEIKLVAQAIQAAGFDDANEAWSNWK